MADHQSDSFKAALQDISTAIGAALSGVAKLNAEHWAVVQSLREVSPEVHANYLRHVQGDTYQDLLTQHQFQIARAVESISKLL